MSTEENKKIILEHLAAVSRGDYAKALEYFAEDAKWCVFGSGKYAGWHNSKKEIVEIWSNLPAFFPKGITVTADRLVAEGDWVAAEAHSYAETTWKGKVYQQKYHYLFEVRDGKIRILKEYLDTEHAKEALL